MTSISKNQLTKMASNFQQQPANNDHGSTVDHNYPQLFRSLFKRTVTIRFINNSSSPTLRAKEHLWLLLLPEKTTNNSRIPAIDDPYPKTSSNVVKNDGQKIISTTTINNHASSSPKPTTYPEQMNTRAPHSPLRNNKQQ